MWIPLATGLRHSVYTVDGPWILSFPVGSCTNTHKQVSQLTSRPHNLPSSWPGPPAPSNSQCTDLWYLQYPAHAYGCFDTFLPKPLILLTS